MNILAKIFEEEEYKISVVFGGDTCEEAIDMLISNMRDMMREYFARIDATMGH